MTVYDQAVELVGAGGVNPPTAKHVVAELDKAGLLAPQLPEPGMTSGNGIFVWRLGKCYMVTGIEGWGVHMLMPNNSEARYNPYHARRLAHALLAAANHAEQEKQ